MTKYLWKIKAEEKRDYQAKCEEFWDLYHFKLSYKIAELWDNTMIQLEYVETRILTYTAS